MSFSERTTMTTEVIYNDTRTHRFMLYKHWNSDKPTAAIIMLYPSYAATVTVDHTTMFTLQNLERLGYGAVYIVNLFSSLNGKHSKTDIDEENAVFIGKAIKEADTVIWAVGTGSDGIKKVLCQQKKVIEQLTGYTNKLKCIADNTGKKFYHPLCPAVRYWNLVDFELKELKAYNLSYDELTDTGAFVKKQAKSSPNISAVKIEATENEPADGKSWYDEDDSGENDLDTEEAQEEAGTGIDEEAIFNDIPEIIIEPKPTKGRKKRK